MAVMPGRTRIDKISLIVESFEIQSGGATLEERFIFVWLHKERNVLAADGKGISEV
jgi:hypothetical protein